MIDAIFRIIDGKGNEDLFNDEFEEKYQHLFQENPHNSMRKEILNQAPKIKGLCGPMYDGERHGYPCIRYESWEMNDILSR